MKGLIVNADGYGFTEGITRAIEECVRFGTVRSISANVNFPAAERITALVRDVPDLSVGCHLNPVVGKPLLPTASVSSLVNDEGTFWYRSFRDRFTRGLIDERQLRKELLAQIEQTRTLAGNAFTHVDFHMGLHRLPRLYPIFLDSVAASGAGRMRTHKYISGLESSFPRTRHLVHILQSPPRLAKYLYNMRLRRTALRRGLAMPDAWVEITAMNSHPERITTGNFLQVLRHLPDGCFEFVVHPAYIDDELRRWSTYIEAREQEREILLSESFRSGFARHGVRLMGYRDIPIHSQDLDKRL
jgi:chitin disaccharide deacetylase